MKILMVNVSCGIGSTGRICTELADSFERNGHEVKIAYGRDEVPKKFQKYAVKIGTDLDVKLHGVKVRLFDACGFGSKRATRKFIRWADGYNPDLLWLHNIHGYYINIDVLFKWIKARPKMKVKWTLHDCWAFTGHCAYFTMAGCAKWKTHCEACPQKGAYPASILFDNSAINFKRKNALFTGIHGMTLITPSKWLADLVKDSFLKEYPVEVVYNTIDTSVFKPTPSDFRKRYGIGRRKMILGVANVWEQRKGLDDFYKLAGMLDDSYVVVLVGLNQQQIKVLPIHLNGLSRMNSATELEAVFSTADYYANSIQMETSEMAALEETPHGDASAIYKGCKEVESQHGGIAVPQGVENIYKVITGHDYIGNHKDAACKMIICIPRTESPDELARIYTAADFFVNPTYEDNYPTVNLEAKSCGTFVITYDTGGAKETLEKNG